MRKLILTFAVVAAMSLACAAYAESRNALLIANSKYEHFSSLKTPVNEARDLKATLEKIGFSVTLLENCSMKEMTDALEDFEGKLDSAGGIGFFHYGGHAVQVDGHNYLIPADADIPNERRVSSRAVDVSEVVVSMVAETNIIILDSCRNNPLPESSTRSATRGLVMEKQRPKNSIIIYSAQENSVARDGVFTPILTRKLLEKKSLTDILIDVRLEVSEKTDWEQIPVEYSQLTKRIYLANYTPPAPPAVTKTAPAVKTTSTRSKEDYNTTAINSFTEIAKLGNGDMIYSDSTSLTKGIRMSLEEYTSKGATDIVFVIDATGSMKDEMVTLRRELVPLIKEKANDSTTLRLGLLLYRDYGGDFSYKGIPVKYYPFTSDFDQFEKNLNSFVIHGTEGGDVPEAVYEALYGAIDFFPWNKVSQKKIILVGDAPPHSTPRGNKKYSKDNVKSLAEKKGITIDAIIVPDRRSDKGFSPIFAIEEELPVVVEAKPVISGKVAVAAAGVLPRGDFCKAVGYLPGDKISISNKVNGGTTTLIVLGSIDSSEGVAILLSPEAAEKLGGIKQDMQVSLTKRSGSVDNAATGSTAISVKAK